MRRIPSLRVRFKAIPLWPRMDEADFWCLAGMVMAVAIFLLGFAAGRT